MNDRDQPRPKADTPGTDHDEVSRLRSRLEALKSDLGEAVAEEKAEAKAAGHSRASGGAMGIGLRAGSDLVAGVLVGSGIGWLLDRQFDLSPLFLIVFMMLGVATGFWNIYRLGARSSVNLPGNGKT